MDTLSEYVVSKIIDFKHGDAKYWKNKFTSDVLSELTTTRFIRICCDCEGCTEKPHYGCYYFREFNYSRKPTKKIMELLSVC